MTRIRETTELGSLSDLSVTSFINCKDSVNKRMYLRVGAEKKMYSYSGGVAAQNSRLCNRK